MSDLVTRGQALSTMETAAIKVDLQAAANCRPKLCHRDAVAMSFRFVGDS